MGQDTHSLLQIRVAGEQNAYRRIHRQHSKTNRLCSHPFPFQCPQKWWQHTGDSPHDSHVYNIVFMRPQIAQQIPPHIHPPVMPNPAARFILTRMFIKRVRIRPPQNKNCNDTIDQHQSDETWHIPHQQKHPRHRRSPKTTRTHRPCIAFPILMMQHRTDSRRHKDGTGCAAYAS